MKKITVLATALFAVASLAGCAGVGKGIGKGIGKGKTPVAVEQPVYVAPEETFVTKG